MIININCVDKGFFIAVSNENRSSAIANGKVMKSEYIYRENILALFKLTSNVSCDHLRKERAFEISTSGYLT